MVKAVLFDIGSTLIEANPDIDHIFYKVATRRGHKLELDEAEKCLPIVNEFYEKEYLKDGDFWCSPQGSVEIFLDMYRYFCHLTGLERDADAIVKEIHEHYLSARAWKIYEDVKPCLKELKRDHLVLGVVSNWSTSLKDLLRDLQLLPYFEVVTSSADIGYRKPNPLIFELTLETLALSPDEVVHVGDRIDADVKGAQEAGITPVLLDRSGRYLGTDHSFSTISSLSELPTLIRTDISF